MKLAKILPEISTPYTNRGGGRGPVPPRPPHLLRIWLVPFIDLTGKCFFCYAATMDGSTVRWYGTLVRYAFFVMVRLRHVGTVRLSYNGTGKVRWYAV